MQFEQMPELRKPIWYQKLIPQTMDIYFVIVYAMLVIQDVHEFLGKDFRIYNAGTK